ncbi:DUF4136 domain-containing protein [Sphingosinicella microcystinivorans]|uniref:DUF4136 domain-containing protein n=1 Tax=Sphingosinicella microcystinivorans TaxID=335406 RepID=UPI0022F3A471|nr:DUF4136 domain-containing protein [Sphingosinicella microcystinivorans]WBX85640.1 DUF4136 domain-containing protein [Sphingosinicella microcystinivorans]
MKLPKILLSLGLLALVAACTTPFTADVSRFQRLPAPSGESFAIEARDPARSGGLEFAQYASYVENKLVQQGYQRAASPEAATLVVKLDYGVNDGREKIDTRYTGFGAGYGWGGWGWPYYSRYRYHPYYWGSFYDPFWGPGYGGAEVYSYTVYRSFLDMDIVRKNGAPVFEGRAEATTRSSDLTKLVPNLVEAMFQGFPGNSGQTVRVKVDQKKSGY